MRNHALLAFADGTVFEGTNIGIRGKAIGEVVFNTAMTGYQEVLTDLSYTGQIVTFTHPHIGNTGINQIDYESNKIAVSGLIIRECSTITSSWRSTQSFRDWIIARGLIGIADIDTRHLTHYLRAHGAQIGCICSSDYDAESAITFAKSVLHRPWQDNIKKISAKNVYNWSCPSDNLIKGYASHVKKRTIHVVVYDFGVKHAILRQLVDRGCKVTIVPALTDINQLLALKADAIVLSNGPGDPSVCIEIINLIRKIIKLDYPILGICLGHQLLALALGAKTFKLKFGHHGINHPVKNILTGRVAISSQNHNYAVDDASLPSDLKVTHRSLFDGTIQGMKHVYKPIMSMQGHPEAGPGPNDMNYLFDEFLSMVHLKLSQGGIYAEACGY